MAQQELQERRQGPGRSQPGQQNRPAEHEGTAEADDSPEAEVPVAKRLRPPLPLMAMRHVISIGAIPGEWKPEWGYCRAARSRPNRSFAERADRVQGRTGLHGDWRLRTRDGGFRTGIRRWHRRWRNQDRVESFVYSFKKKKARHPTTGRSC
ncbi:hypothetical protein [Planctomicrobium sp. SH527]|uniref:hypothetical protein n=1 Tax=Planctomicrobium sp. SH527 TaxID=3448123 RepID=UPI003F5B558D